MLRLLSLVIVLSFVACSGEPPQPETSSDGDAAGGPGSRGDSDGGAWSGSGGDPTGAGASSSSSGGGDPLPDDCPGDDTKTAPGVCGCGVADDDTDGDGTLDCLDGCPEDAAKTSPLTCGCGDTEEDSDLDGLPDCLDGCPTDAGKSAPGACGCGVTEDDWDGDGTPNCLDDCVYDSSKVTPGVCGCGVADADADGDGVLGCHDGCPSDAAKTEPGACGCHAADIDGDGDGAADCIDACAADPNKTTPGVCGCGTPDSDDDADGTADCEDACPSDGNKTEPGLCGCGEIDGGAAGATQTMFVTSQTFTGDLMARVPSDVLVDYGLGAADALCQEAAASAGLGRNFMAVVSSAKQAADRVELCGPVVSTTGATIFSSHIEMFASGSMAMIDIDENGDTISGDVAVWTGSFDGGVHDLSNRCGAWGAEDGSGRVGNAQSGSWLDDGTQDCVERARLYCIGQAPAEPGNVRLTHARSTLVLDEAPEADLWLVRSMSYGPHEDLSAWATWSTSNSSFATVDGGHVTGVAPGEVTITATYDNVAHERDFTVASTAHYIFMSSTGYAQDQSTWGNLAKSTQAMNQHCQESAAAAGLAGTWLMVDSEGFVRRDNNMSARVQAQGPVLNMYHEVVFDDDAALYPFPDPSFRAWIRADENGSGVGYGTEAWTSYCTWDYWEMAFAADMGITNELYRGKRQCGIVPRRVICFRE